MKTKPKINWAKIWRAFDQWSMTVGRYDSDTLNGNGKRVVSREVNRQLAGIKANRKRKTA